VLRTGFHDFWYSYCRCCHGILSDKFLCIEQLYIRYVWEARASGIFLDASLSLSCARPTTRARSPPRALFESPPQRQGVFPRRQAQITLFLKVCGQRRFEIKGKGEEDVRCQDQDPWCTSLRSRGIVVVVVARNGEKPARSAVLLVSGGTCQMKITQPGV
jgi:hypothetical protein